MSLRSQLLEAEETMQSVDHVRARVAGSIAASRRQHRRDGGRRMLRWRRSTPCSLINRVSVSFRTRLLNRYLPAVSTSRSAWSPPNSERKTRPRSSATQKGTWPKPNSDGRGIKTAGKQRRKSGRLAKGNGNIGRKGWPGNLTAPCGGSTARGASRRNSRYACTPHVLLQTCFGFHAPWGRNYSESMK